MASRACLVVAVLLLGGFLLWMGLRAPTDVATSQAGEGREVLGDDPRGPETGSSTSPREEERAPPRRPVARARLRLQAKVLDAEGKPAAGLSYRVTSLREWTYWSDWAELPEAGVLAEEIESQEGLRVALRAPGHLVWSSAWSGGGGGGTVDFGEIRLVRAESISGSVVGTDGLPVPAEIFVAPEGTPHPSWWELYDGGSYGDLLTSIGTDAEGRFTIDHLPPGVYSIGCNPETGRERVLTGIPSGTKDLRFQVDVPARRDEAAWTIRVTDPEGRPVPQFTARVGDGAGNSESGSGLDGSVVVSGRFTPPIQLVVDDATDSAGVLLPLAPAIRTALSPRGGDMDVRLEPGAVLAGRVMYGDEPVVGTVGAGYRLLPSGEAVPEDRDVASWLMQLVPRGVQTDARGAFRLTNLPRGEVRLFLQHEDYVLGPENRTASPGGRDLEIQCLRKPWVDVRVSAPHGEPLTKASVKFEMEVSGHSFTLGSEERASKVGATEIRLRVTDTHGWGTAVTRDVRVVYALRVTGQSGDRTWAETRRGDVHPGTDVAVRLGADEPLVGRVVDAKGDPVPQARVLALSARPGDPKPAAWTTLLEVVLPYTRREVKAGLDGRFEIPADAEGLRFVTADAPGQVHRDVPVPVPPGGDVGDLVLVPGHAVSGHLQASALDPLPVRLLLAWSVRNPDTPVATAPVRDDGFFRLVGLRPGSYRVAALMLQGPSRLSPDGPPSWVLSDPVEAGTHGLRVPVLPGRSLRVRVVGRDGVPLALASVRVSAAWVLRTYMTGEDGTATFGALPRAPLEVTVRAADGRQAERTVTAEADEVEVTL